MANSHSQTARRVSPQAYRRSWTIAPTQVNLPENSKIKASQNGMITGGLKKGVYLQLVQERNGLRKVVVEAQSDLSEANKTALGLTKQIEDKNKEMETKDILVETLNTNNKAKDKAIQEKNKLIEDKDAEIKAYVASIDTMKTKLDSAVQALKDAGKHAKSEQSKDIIRNVSNEIKANHCPKVNFVRDEH